MSSIKPNKGKESDPIYLDYNATTPVKPAVSQAMEPYLGGKFGNPSSSHLYGKEAKKAVKQARSRVAKLIGTKPKRITFTSGGTESNNYVIKGAALAHQGEGNHIITSRIEHPSVLRTCEYLENQGFEVTYLPVDETGRVDPARLEEAIGPDTTLVTIMHANNEIGTIQPLNEISNICKEENVLFHTDAAQTLGKVPVKVDDLGVDLLSIAGHKAYAPKGIGALYIGEGVKLQKLIHGAGQEKGRRAGTENVPEIAGLGKACQLAAENLEKYRTHMEQMKEKLRSGLANISTRARFNGDPDRCLPNTLSTSFKGVEADRLLSEVSNNVAASAGAACHSGDTEISHVLKALGLPEEWAKGTVRFSTGRMTTDSEIDEAVSIVEEALE